MIAIAMWAHPRSVSTAFLRMMMERGDVTVVHEPLVTLGDTGQTEVPDGAGGSVTCRSTGEVMAALRRLAAYRPLFFKDTLEYRYDHFFDTPADLLPFQHTFIVRSPTKAIPSHFALKPDVSCSDIGYEHQYDLFELVWRTTGQRPVVISSERLLADPERVVAAYCLAAGLPFRPEALHWAPQDRPEWQRTRRWHLDTIESSGLVAAEKTYAVTIDNDDRLRSYYDHHKPFYDRLLEHAL